MPIIEPTEPNDAPANLPIRNQRSTFSTRVDAFITWFVGVVPQVLALAQNAWNNATEAFNAATTATAKRNEASDFRNQAQGFATTASDAATVAAAAAAAATISMVTSTSATEVTIGTGAKVFVTQAGKQYSVGVPIIAVDQANPANYMAGTVDAYAGTSLTIAVTSTGGAGTISAWNISIAGVRGAQGPAGALNGDATGSINLIEFAPIATAATVDLDAAAGNFGHLTGDETIAAFTLTKGSRTCVVDGSPIITSNANIVTLGTGNIPCEPGDVFEVTAEGSGVVRITDFVRKSGKPLTATSASGITTTNPMSGNIVLTVNSSLYQVVRPDAYGRTVKLAAANTLPSVGAVSTVVQNDSGVYPVKVLNNADEVVGWVMPGKRIAFAPKSIASAAGEWITTGTSDAENGGVFPVVKAEAVFTPSSTSIRHPTFMVSDKVTIATWVHTDGNLYMTSYLRDTGTGSAGSVQVHAATNSVTSQHCPLVMLTATRGVVVYSKGTTVYARSFDVNLTTGALTMVSGETSLPDSGGSGTDVFADYVDATRLVALYKNASGYARMCILTMDGSGNLTAGSEPGLPNVGASLFDVVMLTDTLGIVLYAVTTIRRFTVAAGVITLGTEVTLTEGALQLIKASATTAFALVQDTFYKARVITDTGVAAVTVGSLSDAFHDPAVSGCRFVRVRDNRAALFMHPASNATNVLVTMVGVSAGVPVATSRTAIQLAAGPSITTVQPMRGYGQQCMLSWGIYHNSSNHQYLQKIGLV